jgi:hypothetical protein
VRRLNRLSETELYVRRLNENRLSETELNISKQSRTDL